MLDLMGQGGGGSEVYAGNDVWRTDGVLMGV
jgi:hypothetical protein